MKLKQKLIINIHDIYSICTRNKLMIKNIHTHIFMNENEQQMSQLETRHPIVHTDTEHQANNRITYT